jgi:hypothetical protein
MNEFILLHEKYKFSNPIENEDNSEYHYYKLLIINNIEYQNYIKKEEIAASGFILEECCTAMDYQIFLYKKNSKKSIINKWSNDMYGIAIKGRKNELVEISHCPWCGAKLQ